MGISTDVCARQGHKIESLRIKDTNFPVPGGSPIVKSDYETMCVSCGMPLEEIRLADKRRSRSPRRPGNGKSQPESGEVAEG